jgi:hypothetical protein
LRLSGAPGRILWFEVEPMVRQEVQQSPTPGTFGKHRDGASWRQHLRDFFDVAGLKEFAVSGRAADFTGHEVNISATWTDIYLCSGRDFFKQFD